MEENVNKDNLDTKKQEKKKSALNVLLDLVLFFCSFLVMAVRWVFSYFSNVSIDTVFLQMNKSLEGTDSKIILDGIIGIGVFGFLIYFIVKIIYMLIKKFILKDKAKHKHETIYLILAIVIYLSYIFIKSDILGYIIAKNTDSKFFANNYVEPSKVEITFPEEKKNLIYIILESMENSFMDKERLGVMETNLIPEITKLQKENVSFSHTNEPHGGAINFSGVDCTIASLVAQSTGIPLYLIDNEDNDKLTEADNFLNSYYTLGDVLEENGYNQVFMCGSSASFAGRGTFYRNNGNYKIYDYDYIIGNKIKKDENYAPWGIYDYELYEHAKEEITRLAKENKPFNFTMLTVDTHHMDGTVCKKCILEYGKDNQYKNVISCASGQVYAFINWIKEQGFYENTVIVVVGDHPSMSSTFDEYYDDSYEKTVVNCFINSSIEPINTNKRVFSVMDLYPTTLAAMGAKIEGDRLGLGTNLFSDKQTIIEEVGEYYFIAELRKRSDFYQELVSETMGEK